MLPHVMASRSRFTGRLVPRWFVGGSIALCALAATGCRKKKIIDDETLSLAVGARHACALMINKGVRCWGANDMGQLGETTREPHPTPVRLRGTTERYTDLEAGGTMTCARTQERGVECWGSVRRATSRGDEPVPIDVSSLKDVEQIALGESHGCVRLEQGTVRCFGNNDRGQLGAGHTNRLPGVVEVSGLWGVVWLSAGKEHTCAVLTDTSVRCWGRNHEGQLGDGTTKDSASPVSVAQVQGAKRVAAGGAHSCALVSDGAVRCWGKNDHGQLGDGTKVRHPIATPVANLSEQKGVAAGDSHSCSFGVDASVRCWGQNNHSQMADGTSDDRTTPHRVAGFAGQGITAVPEQPFALADVKLGDGFTCVRASDKRIRCWGKNDQGQAGDGTREVRAVPVGVKLQKVVEP